MTMNILRRNSLWIWCLVILTICDGFTTAVSQDLEDLSGGDVIVTYDSLSDFYKALRSTSRSETSVLRNLADSPFEIFDGIYQDSGLTFSDNFKEAFFLKPTIIKTKCHAWDSCILRCGDPTLGAPYLCSCDPDCTFYKDCCVDYKFYCVDGTSGTSTASVAALDIGDDFEGSGSGEVPEDGEEEEEEETSTPETPEDGAEVGGPVVIIDDPEANIRLLCIPKDGAKYYGRMELNGQPVNRKCILEKPPWCDPEFSQFWGWTPSMSMLMNFGPEGWNNDLLFSSDFYGRERCESIWEIWDPFFRICRPIECNKEYIIEDGKCQWAGESPEPPNIKDLIGFKPKEANITFFGRVLWPDEYIDKAVDLMNQDMAHTLSQKLRVEERRITSSQVSSGFPEFDEIWWGDGFNSSMRNPDEYDEDDIHLWVLTEDGFPMTITFDLHQRAEVNYTDLSIEQVLSVFGEAVASRAVLRTTNGVPMKIHGYEKVMEQEELTFFKEWCRGGDLIEYWNEQFQVVYVLKNTTEGVKLEMAAQIRETQVIYDQGTYVANLLYQSTDWNEDAANVSGVIIVCENRPWIQDPNCVRLRLNETEYEITDEGNLQFLHEVPGVKPIYNRSEYEFGDDGEAIVCIEYNEAKDSYWELSFAEKAASVITTLAMCLSLLGLFLTFTTYVIFAELRTLPGCCLMHFCASEFSFFLAFIVGARRAMTENEAACTTFALLTHFCVLAFFSWSTIISFDLYATFATFQAVARSRRKYLWRYTLIGYSVPFAIVFVSMMIDFHSNVDIGYGDKVCWIGNPELALYIFALPIAVAIVATAVLFVLTVRAICRSTKNPQLAAVRRQDRFRFSIYVRITSVQCFAWILGFLAIFFNFSLPIARIIEFAFILLNSLQGIGVFLAFGMNARVVELYRGWWRGDGRRRTSSYGYDPSSFSGRVTVQPWANKKGSETSRTGKEVKPVAARTVSNETAVSFVSDGSSLSSLRRC